jgi:NitT/TauT family transport system permease protein
LPSRRIFKTVQPTPRRPGWSDLIVLTVVAALLYAGTRLAFQAPAEIKGPAISLKPGALPYYAGLSIGRMLAAYGLSMSFTLVYGRLAAYHRRAEQVLMPLLDILQSVPILSFLPMVLLSFSAILPEDVAVELASIVLIFTSQAWNLTFAWYQSLTTIPKDLQEASATFRFNGWLRFKTLELPFAVVSLIWNSMMSWAGGWFFLMAAEIFTVGQRDFRLPGLGAYLQEAANQNNTRAIMWGIGTLVLVIVALDQLVWRPLLAWSERFKLEMVESDHPPASWFYAALRGSRLANGFSQAVLSPAGERLDSWLVRRFPVPGQPAHRAGRPAWLLYLMGGLGGVGLAYGVYQAGQMLLSVPLMEWGTIGVSLLATLLRVVAALTLALAWTIPLGVLIGTSPRLSAWLHPLVQIIASVPATALFPVFVLILLGLPGGLNLAAVLLMLMGTQWYLLFNIIAGATAIPQDLRYTSALLDLKRWDRWRTLILPGLFPYIITGAITASGGAWNASIVAERIEFGGQTLHTLGVGALIGGASAAGNYPLLLAATLSMILSVAAINRLVWRRLYRLAEERYRME